MENLIVIGAIIFFGVFMTIMIVSSILDCIDSRRFYKRMANHMDRVDSIWKTQEIITDKQAMIADIQLKTSKEMNK